MNKIKKLLIIVAAFVLLAFKCEGGEVFTNGSYSSLVFYLCYIFVSFDNMKCINEMSLHRYGSLKDFYIRMCKKQIVMVFLYTFLFMVIGVCSEMIGFFRGGNIFVSFEARIKFFIFSYMNLFILNCFQMVIRILYGKWIALVTVCLCVFVSICQLVMQYNIITPFVFHTAYLRGKTILSYHTIINYILCLIIITCFTVLSMKKDKQI